MELAAYDTLINNILRRPLKLVANAAVIWKFRDLHLVFEKFET